MPLGKNSPQKRCGLVATANVCKAISKRISKMKTYKRLIDFALSDENMDEALKSAAYRKLDRPAVQEVFALREPLKKVLREKILKCELKPIIHDAHEINDGFKQKKRTIIQPYFTKNKPEQWLQHIVINTLKPVFMKGMFEFSCGSIPGRGIHYGKRHIEKFIRKNPKEIKYVLKIDIRHFYESIKIERLKDRFRKIIKDEIFLNLIFWVLDSNLGVFKDGRTIKNGLPIGFYTSQWFANWFLQPFDHFVKEELKARCYVRYMDDIVIFGSNKRKLHRDFKRIQEYLNGLDLEVKANWQVFKFDYIDESGKRSGRPVDFMGFKFYRDKTTIRKSIFLRACRLARRLNKKSNITWRDASQILSYYGWFKQTDTCEAFEKYISSQINLNICKTIMSKYDKKQRRKNGNNLQTSSEFRQTD